MVFSLLAAVVSSAWRLVAFLELPLWMHVIGLPEEGVPY